MRWVKVDKKKWGHCCATSSIVAPIMDKLREHNGLAMVLQEDRSGGVLIVVDDFYKNRRLLGSKRRPIHPGKIWMHGEHRWWVPDSWVTDTDERP